MSVSVLQLLLYVVLIGAGLYCFCLSRGKPNKWVLFVRQHLPLLIMMLVINTLSFGLSLKKAQDNYQVNRQSYGGDVKEYGFRITNDEQETDYTLTVAPRKLKPKEADERMESAFKYLEDHLKGDNPSFMEIYDNLDITLPHDEYPFDMEVIPDNYSLINKDGIVRNEESQLKDAGFDGTELLSGISSSVKIVLWYGDIKREKNYEMLIFPRKKNEWEKQLSAVTAMLERKENESLYEDAFVVPASYNGLQIVSLNDSGLTPMGVLVIGFLIVGLLLLREMETKRQQELLRRQDLLYAYPWFINEMVLLLGAGMQMKNIFTLLISETGKMRGDDHRRFLIDELKQAKHGFEIGMSEGRIYYELGRRLQLPCYIKIMNLLEQNVTKGSKGLVGILEKEERNALVERMNLAKKRGEEAGTKLLGPMILMLLIIMLMIMVPAFLSFA